MVPAVGTGIGASGFDPKYEFCAPQYHDFTRVSCGGQEEAENWFKLLNQGLIDTDLSSPQSTAEGKTPARSQAKGVEPHLSEDEDVFEDEIEPGPAATSHAQPRVPSRAFANAAPRLNQGNHPAHVSATTHGEKAVRARRSERLKTVIGEVTIGHEPNLRTSQRTRPPEETLTTEERQLLESRQRQEQERQKMKRQRKRHTLPLTLSGKRDASHLGKSGTLHQDTTSSTLKRIRHSGEADVDGTSSAGPGATQVACAPSSREAYKTPLREVTRRSAQAACVAPVQGVQSQARLTLTVPHSPMLSTKSRARSAHVKSTAELEQEAMAGFQARPFKARPMSAGVMKGARMVPSAPKRPFTRSEGFKLRTEQRAAESSARADHAGDATSPAFNTRSRRARSKSMGVPGTSAAPAFRARPAPKFDRTPLCRKKISKTTSRRRRRHTTAFEPFSLATDARGQGKREQLARAVEEREEQEQRARQFVASEIPDTFELYSRGIAQVRPRQPTVPSPFSLAGSRYHEAAEARTRDARAARDEQENLARKFVARPISGTRRAPLTALPPQPPRQLTRAQSVELQSDARAGRRRAWDERRKEREAEDAVQRRRDREEQERQEKEEIRRLRKSMEFKARPLPSYLRGYDPWE